MKLEENIRALQSGGSRLDAGDGDWSLFPGAALDWYMSLKAADIPTWADLSSKFIDQYRYCAEMPPTLLELSTMEMTEYKGFEAYAVKWRARAAKHVPPIRAYYLHLLAHTSSFSNLIDAGKKLDIGIKLGKIEGEYETGQEAPAPFVIEYVPAKTGVGYAEFDATPAPLVIEVPAREPYQDSKVLTAARVPKETAPDLIAETVGSIFSNNISFSDDELPSEGWAHLRALHIVCKCNNFIIGRVMIDNGSALNVCPVSTLKQMNVDFNRIRPCRTAVRAFDGSRRELNGEIDLVIEDHAIYKETAVPYISIGDDQNLPFHSFETISVIRDYGEIGPTRADRMVGKILLCHNYIPDTGLGAHGLDEDGRVPEIEESLRRLEDRQLTSVEPIEEINVGTEEEPRILKIGTGLDPTQRARMIEFLTDYQEVFAWSYADMPGIDPSIVKHFLPLDTERFPPKRQHLRRQRAGLLLRIKEEIIKQINAGFLEVCNYSEWVANFVPVEKKDRRVRVCVDYRDLSKASPKDNFPLPHIDVLVDNTACHTLFSFMDGFSGATYQRAMVTLFHDMMHKEIEVYVDDMIAKSKEGEDHLVNLKRLFDRLKKYKLRLNPTKCTFGAKSGKLLGFVVNERGIEVDPDKRFRKYTLYHTIRLLSKADPLKYLLDSPSSMKNISKWRCQLTKYDIENMHRTSVKGQAIVDHLAEFPIENDTPINSNFPDEWILQTLGQWKTKDEKLVPYHEYLKELAENFEKISFTYIPRIKNQFVDALTTLASMVYADQIKAPPNELRPMAAPWPFSMWGIDVIGPINPKASNRHQFILVAIDYFTKWIEA
ncbi:hypothetical protein CRG98_000686, partial [Punica granatum]